MPRARPRGRGVGWRSELALGRGRAGCVSDADPGGGLAAGQASSTYTLDLGAGAVRVRHDVTLTNLQPDTPIPGGVSRRSLPEFGVGVPAEATAFAAARSDGTSLAVTTEPTESPQFRLAIADLSPDLYYPASQTLSLTYDLPQRAPRQPGVTRVNEAFATFPVYGIGDPGLTRVQVVVPDHLVVELVGDDMVEGSQPGYRTYSAEAIADPDGFFVNVVARDDARLVSRTVELADGSVEVLGWPDDPEWVDFVAGILGDGVPALERLIGLPWPAEDLKVVETVAPYLYGYAGWFTPSLSTIEVGDELDPQVILHELSHLWFNGELFTARWINEALAEELAAQALVAIGREPSPFEPPAGMAVLRLNDWGEPDLQSGDAEEREAYGYAASADVLRRVTEEIGIERVAEAVQMANARELAYRADAPVHAGRSSDWRTLLDLLQEVGGSTLAEPIFREVVVTEEQLPLLDQRAAARAEYSALVAAGGTWAPPAAVRRPMAAWEFEEALTAIPAATAALEQRAALVEVLATIEEPLPAPLEASYEAMEDDEGLAPLLAEANDAGEALAAAQQDWDGGVNLLERVGLLFGDIGSDLDGARRDFGRGDYLAARQRAESISERLDGAATTAVVLLGALALLIGAALWVRRTSRGHFDATPADDPVATLDTGGSEPDGAEGVGSTTDGGGQPGV